MATTLAFDVYGTLIDTHGIVAELSKLVGDRAAMFSQRWREKQLEYSFRRGLMQHYEDFSVCTRHALDYVCEAMNAHLSVEQRDRLIDCYRSLPAFSDAKAGLTTLKQSGYRCFAFSNGTARAVEALLHSAGIDEFFIDIVSVEDVRVFKPSPATYAHFLRRADTQGDQAWLISSNPFDVIGAKSAGMHAAWVRRSEAAIFDPWGIEPDLTVAGLGDLAVSLPAIS